MSGENHPWVVPALDVAKSVDDLGRLAAATALRHARHFGISAHFRLDLQTRLAEKERGAEIGRSVRAA